MTPKTFPELVQPDQVAEQISYAINTWISTEGDDYEYIGQEDFEQLKLSMLNLIKSETDRRLNEAMENAYKKGLHDMFMELAKLAEPDERQFGAGDLNTNMDNVHEIRERLESQVKTIITEYLRRLE